MTKLALIAVAIVLTAVFVLPDDGPARAAGSIDAPYDTSQIKLVESIQYNAYTIRFYRNRAYTCGLSGYQTFVIGYPTTIPTSATRPLWVRMHGGGTGAFTSTGSYLPNGFFPGSLDEETINELGGLLTETGLIAKVRAHSAEFRFLMPSMCDHDVYSGVGLPEANNPYSPDENGQTRAADGLLATKAAIAFTRTVLPTSSVFLHGTSAGAAGAFTVAYSFEREGIHLSGIVMDSALIDPAIFEVLTTVAVDHPEACVANAAEHDAALELGKIGAATDTANLPRTVVPSGEMTVPIMHVWDHNDPIHCGDYPMTTPGGTMGAMDYVHDALRQAIDALPASNPSENLRACVTLAGGQPCDLHSPTKYAYTEATPPGDADHGGMDYNQYIMDWASARLPVAVGGVSTPPPPMDESPGSTRTAILALVLAGAALALGAWCRRRVTSAR